MFIPKGNYVGRKVKLNHNLNVTTGTFLKGSVMVITGYSPIDKRFDLCDLDSGETLYSCSMSNGDNTDKFNFVD